MGTALRTVLAVAVLGVFVAGCAGESPQGPESGGGMTTAPAAGGNSDNPHPTAGSFEADDTLISDCEDDWACLEQAFGNLAYEEGPKPAIRLFDRLMTTDDAVEGNCHRIVHMIGSASLARYHGNVAKAFAEGSASCWSGYYHGILSNAFTDVELDDIGSASRGLCDDEEIRATDYLAYQCVHGLGHGLMIYTGYNLPLSLETCDELETEWDQSSCSGGVFMENVTPSLGSTTEWLKDDDPVYPCNAVANRHKYYCYLMVTSRILEVNGYDWEETAATCRGVEKDWVAICFQSYGRDASGSTRQDAAEIIRICGLAARWESDCIYGAARDITSNDANSTRSRELCEAAEGSLKDVCYDGIGTILRSLSADEEEVRQACAEATTQYLMACLRGAGLAS
jgi:hypothetical protein